MPKMCIRDRCEDACPRGQASSFPNFSAKETKKVSKNLANDEAAEYTITAVSYTHLDVYKRQTQTNDDLQGHGSRWEVILPCPSFYFAVSMLSLIHICISSLQGFLYPAIHWKITF